MDTKIERVASRQVDRWKEERVYSNCVEQRARVKHVLPMKMMDSRMGRAIDIPSLDHTSEPIELGKKQLTIGRHFPHTTTLPEGRLPIYAPPVHNRATSREGSVPAR
jgi:hypothetical protein